MISYSHGGGFCGTDVMQVVRSGKNRCISSRVPNPPGKAKNRARSLDVAPESMKAKNQKRPETKQIPTRVYPDKGHPAHENKKADHHNIVRHFWRQQIKVLPLGT